MVINSTYTIHTKSLFDFSNPDLTHYWHSEDDRILGGQSSSRLQPCCQIDTSSATFTGVLRTKKLTSFARVVSDHTHFDLSSYAGIRLRVRGDGKTYGLSIRSSDLLHVTYQYQITFFTGYDWQNILLPFKHFKPIVLGIELPLTIKPINTKNITGMGLFISENQFGNFSLNVEKIEAYR